MQIVSSENVNPEVSHPVFWKINKKTKKLPINSAY